MRVRPGVEVVSLTDVGCQRENNEDNFVYWEPDDDAAFERLGRLALIADGMGGTEGGQFASQIAVDTVQQHYATGGGGDPQQELLEAFRLANSAVQEKARQDARLRGMGTTLTAAAIVGSRLFFAHVGDSRLYLFASGALRHVTRDDSWMASVLAQDPAADPAVFRHHPMRYALTTVVGRRTPPVVHIFETTLPGESWRALTTDGVHGTLGNGRIEKVFGAGSAKDIATKLVSEALAQGSRDNCTAVVAGYEPEA